MKKITFLLSFLLINFFYNYAASQTIDFEGQSWADSENLTNTFTDTGFSFTYEGSLGVPHDMTANIVGFHSTIGDKGFLCSSFQNSDILTIASTDGSEFDFQSFYVFVSGATTMRIRGFKDGTLVATSTGFVVTNLATNNVSSINPDFQNVDTVIFDTGSGGVGLAAGYDNFVFATAVSCAPSGTISFDGSVTASDILVAEHVGTATGTNVLNTCLDFSVVPLPTAALSQIKVIHNSGGATGDDIIRFEAGGVFNTDYVSFSSNDGSEFKLNSFKLSFTSLIDKSVTVSGYKDGALVGSSDEGSKTRDVWHTIDLSSNNIFDDVDEIRISYSGGMFGVQLTRLDDIVFGITNTPPTITSTPITSVNQGGTYTYTITTNDVDGDITTVTAPTLPSWLSLTTAGTVTTFAGSGISGSVNDTGTAASFNNPRGVAVDISGNIYVADSENHRIRKITPTGVVSTFAGSGVPGFAEGTGVAAQFFNPRGVAVDGAGNIYVTDIDNHRIRKITPTGVVSTLAGSSTQGSADGTGTAAQFNGPAGITVDGTGNVYVAELMNHRIRKITPTGVVTTFAGSTQGFADDTGTSAQFNIPSGVAIDLLGNLYVAEQGNHLIRKITPTGVVTTFAGSTQGFADGTGTSAQFNIPFGLEVDASGSVYVADFNNDRIRKITPAGIVTTLAGSTFGFSDGVGSSVQFFGPSDVTVDASGAIYVGDRFNHRIRRIEQTVRLIGSSSGQIGDHDVVLEANDGNGGIIQQAFTITINTPPTFTSTPITSVDEGDTYTYNITTNDTDGDPVTLTTPTLPSWLTLTTTTNGTVSTLAGMASSLGSSDGTGTAANFFFPIGVAVDASGTIYVADPGNNTIRKITPAGVVSTFSGMAGSSGSADGTGTAARFDTPVGVAVDASGSVYVADRENHLIRKITSAGVVSTFAGMAGVSGSADGTGTAASFNRPIGVAVDALGNVYVGDRDNDAIRKITPSGLVTTFAGMAGNSGSTDGTGTSAQFDGPEGITVDLAGNVYVADKNNHLIRKITPGGVVTTFAGMAGNPGSTDGTGITASFRFPSGIAIDASGTIYVADGSNHTIRKITPAGVVTTFAGMAGVSGSANGTGTAASFNTPLGIAIDASGAIYVADSFNHIIRRIDFSLQLTGDSTGQAGMHDVVLEANDGNGGVTQQAFTITVNTPPSFTSTPITSVNEGDIYTYNITTNDIDSDAVSITVSTLPSWLSFSATIVSSLAGSGSDGNANGTGAAASFEDPRGLTTDAAGNIYVADASNNLIRKITPAGVVTTLAGSGSFGSTDGNGTAASFSNPQDVAIDAMENVYVTDQFSRTIRKITPAGLVSTFAGSTGMPGNIDGTGSAARFNFLVGIAIDASGTLYTADAGNHNIRKITPAGEVTTLAGSGASGSSDGTGTGASFNRPNGLTVDASGNVYVVTAGDHLIRKVTPAGVVTTIAGSGSAGNIDGLGTAASFFFPTDIDVDTSGNLYVVHSSVVRKITSAGEVTTFAGSGDFGSANGPAATASFGHPNGIAVDASGNFYVADREDNRIRKLTPSPILTGDSTGQIGDHPVVLEANDGNGGIVQQSFTITVNDATNPVIVCPADTTIEFGDSTAPGDLGTATATDNSDPSPVITFEDVIIPGTGSNSTIERTWTATDASDNFSTCVQTITIQDTTAPSGYSVTIDQDPIDVSNATAVSFTFADAEVGATYDYTFSSSGGSGTVTGTGTISTVTDQITGIDLSGISDGTISLSVTLTDPSNNVGAAVSDTSTKNTIVAITVDDPSSAETDSGTATLQYTVSLETAALETITVDVATSDGSASAGSDYTALTTTLTFMVGETTQTVDVSINGDTTLEADETINLNLTNATGPSVITDATGVGTITNDDSASVTIADISGNEEDGVITITATVDNAVQGGFTVDVSTIDGTALTADSDYTAVTSQTLTFAGNAGETQTFTISPTADTKLETDETLTVSQSNLAGTTLGVVITDGATVTITNDDTATVTIEDITVNEADGTTTLITTLDNPVQDGFVLHATTVDGTAIASDDFTAITDQAVATFAGTLGETQNIVLTLTDDMLGESVEELTMTLSSISGTTLAASIDITDTATITINDDDAPVVTMVSVPADGTYGIGDNLDFSVTFTNPASITGSPSIPLTIGSTTVQAVLNGTVTDALTADFRYTVVEGDLDTDGIVVGGEINLNAGSIIGSSGIPAILTLNGVASTANVNVDGIKPTVVITADAAIPTNIAFTATITFSEDVTGFDLGDISVGNGTASSFTMTSATVYTALITPTVDGMVTVDVNAEVAQDLVGNDNLAATQYSVLYDATNPTLTITTTSPDPTNMPFTIDIVFDEDITDFDITDLSVTNGTPSAFTMTSATIYSALITPTISDDVVINIAMGAAQDAATNPNDAASFSIEYDDIPPLPPQITHVSDYTCTGDTSMTGDNTLEISGIAEQSSMIEVFQDGSSIGTTITLDTGFYTFDHTATTLADGSYSFTVTATDIAGNTSDLSAPLNITINSVDTDGDGLPDFCDDDDDGNGVVDADEDCDGDGIIDSLDTDNSSCSNSIQQIKSYGFSPNGDGVNDGWFIENITSFPNNLVQVFNRSGKLVFKLRSYQNDWEGISNQISNNGSNKPLPVGPYLFIIDLGDGSQPTRGWLYINY